MKKLVIIIVMAFCCEPCTLAQDFVPKIEVTGGYLLLRRDSASGGHSINHGWTTEATFNFNRWLGVTANFGGTYDSVTDPFYGTFTDHEYPLLFGPTLKYRMRHFEPYVHTLFGLEHAVFTIPPGAPFYNGVTSGTENQFAVALGGGVDVLVSKHFALRVVNLDYYQIKTSNPFHNLRFATGLQLRF